MKKIFITACFLIIVILTFAQTGDVWIQKADFGESFRIQGVGFSIGDKGYVGTGYDINGSKKDFWEYDPATDTWTQKADFGGTGRDGAVGFSIGNKGYLGTGNNTKDFWEYDPVTNSWLQKADFAGGGRTYAVGFNIANKGYIGAGQDIGHTLKKDFWEYDPATDTWTQKADYGGWAVIGPVGFSIGNKGYMGLGQVFGVRNEFYEYDPSTDKWTKKANLGGTGSSHAVSFTIGSKGYVATGYNVASYLKEFWEYDPFYDTWTRKSDFGGVGRFGAVGFSIGGKAYMGLGDDESWELRDFWEYTPGETTTSVPTITSFLPTSGPVGTTVTITGTNFGANPSDNIVYFGATKATVTTATSTSLTVMVPFGATYEPLTVTTNGLTAYASKPFTVTFDGGNKPFTDSLFVKEPGIKTGKSHIWGSTPFGITMGDYDGDGKADLAATITWFDTVEVYRNISVKGGIIFAEKTKLPVGIDRFRSNKILIHSSDIDGDGKLDLIATNEGNSDYNLYHGGISFFRNNSTNGTISFEPEIYYRYLLSRTQDVAIADFNGDGKSDLARLDAGGDPPYWKWSLSILRNTSTPENIAFAGYTIFEGEEGKYVDPISIAARDFDNDGKPDLTWIDSRLNKVYIARNISTPDSIMFADKIEYTAAPSPYYITAADFDNDGKQDIVIANNGSATVSVFRNISAGENIAFAEKQDFVVSAAANGLAIADLNGDGMPDIAAATDNNPFSISLLQNKSTIGTIDFAVNADYDVTGSSAYICSGDLDGDGKPDIAATRYGADTISILRNIITAANICNPPTALSVAKIRDTAALLKWTLPGEPVSGFKIRYRAVGTTELVKRNIKGSSNHIILCGLLPNTTYQWQIRSNCAADTSGWVRGPNFTTTAAASFALPGTTSDLYSKVPGSVGLQIVPNPGNGNFIIQMQLPAKDALTTLALYNSLGERIWQQQAGMLSGTVTKSIMLHNKLSAGVYILKIERSDVQLTQRVVVSK